MIPALWKSSTTSLHWRMERLSLNQNRSRHTHGRAMRFAKLSSLLALAAALSGCSLLSKNSQDLAPPLVKPVQERVDAVDVKKGTIERFFSGTATVVSKHDVPLFYKDNGRLKEILV